VKEFDNQKGESRVQMAEQDAGIPAVRFSDELHSFLAV
jgi:hypothetical protein